MRRKNTSNDIIKKLFYSLIPIQALSAGLPAITSLLSTFIIGNYLGAQGLAVMGFAGPLSLLATTVAVMISTGAQLLCGRYIGEGSRDGIQRSFSTAADLCVLLGLPMTAACLLSPVGIARLMGAAGECLAPTADYIRGFAPGIIFTVFSSTVLPFLQMDRAEKLSTVCISAMVAVNLGLNLVNALWLDWGLFGVGLTMTLSNLVLTLIAVPHFLGRSELIRYSVRAFDRSCVKEIFYQGVPAGLQKGFLLLRVRIINQLLFNIGGTAAVSAFTVADKVSDASGVVISVGCCGSGRLIASVLAGEKDRKSLSELPGIMIRCGFPFYAAAYVLVFALARPLAVLMGAESAFIGLYVMAIRVYNLWFLTNIFHSSALGVYQSLGQVRLVSIYYFLNCFVYAVIPSLLLARSVGLPILFSVGWLPELLGLITLALYYAFRSGHLPRSVSDITYIPESFSVSEENIFKYTVRTLDDAIAASKQAAVFCAEKGLDRRTAYFCGLCIEEMATNTVIHGFPRSRKKNCMLDVRIVYENNGVSVMLRDNAPHFDPDQWLSVCASDDPLRGIGIRTVSKLSKEMKYISTLGLNVLTIIGL